jgi:hypothetical protein
MSPRTAMGGTSARAAAETFARAAATFVAATMLPVACMALAVLPVDALAQSSAFDPLRAAEGRGNLGQTC